MFTKKNNTKNKINKKTKKVEVNALNKVNSNKFTFKKDIKYSTKQQPKTIKQLCEVYKKDITGKINLPLYKSCKINQYCRKYKCNDIDKKFKNGQIKKLGINYNTLLLSSLYNKCPATMEDKNRKRCYNHAMLKFYKDNNLGDKYTQLLECDKKTCINEKKIFNTNLFRIRKKGQKQIRLPKKIQIDELPDKDMIEIN
jgi:hypothetical protein